MEVEEEEKKAKYVGKYHEIHHEICHFGLTDDRIVQFSGQ